MKQLYSCNISKPVGTLLIAMFLCTGWTIGNLMKDVTEHIQLQQIYAEEPILDE